MNNTDLHFEKAPIVEAIIAIDTTPILNDEQMAQIEAASESFKADYPESEPLQHVQFQIGVGLGRLPQQAAQHDATFGRKYVSEDKRQLVVFRRNGFNFSRLPPYQRWESFRDEAKRLWNEYRTAAGELAIVRFGLRYINRIDIPIGKPIDGFLKLYPQVPDNSDGSFRTINSSYMRVDSILTEIPGGQLIIQQASLPQQQKEFATLSLDFDISVVTQNGATEEYVWSALETARTIKNQLFVDSLQPDFLETFR